MINTEFLQSFSFCVIFASVIRTFRFICLLDVCSACSNLLVKVSTEFFSAVNVLFGFQISVWHFFCVFYLYIELFILSFCFHIEVKLFMFFCSSLSICVTIILNSFLGNFWISISLGPVTGSLLYSFGGDISPLFFLIPVAL